MSKVTPIGVAAIAEDRSCEVEIHLDSAKAIAELVETICGGKRDASDSRLKDLTAYTLRAAMYALRQHIETAEKFTLEQEQYVRDRVANAKESHS